MTMQTQDIFKAFGSNWKWASISSTGRARIYTGKPSILGSLIQSPVDELVSRCEAFDVPTPANGIVPQIWERTDFSNGPAYETDKFGVPLPVDVPSAPPARGYCNQLECFNEKAVGFNVCETHRPPQLMAPVMPTNPWSSTPAQVPMSPPVPQTRLTTEEAENGKLWDFAKAHENHVLVDALGGVSFGSDVVSVPRHAFDVVVDGVTHPIERRRSQPQLAPPEAGKPFSGQVELAMGVRTHLGDGTPMEHAHPVFSVEKPAPAWPTDAQPRFDYQPAHPGLRDDGLEPPEAADEVEPDEPHGWFDRVDELEKELAKAKLHARLLLNSYDQHGEAELRLSIYLAIFGEQPE